MPSLPFSESLKNVFAQSRLTAFALGYDCITSVHFLLADCQLHPISSLKGLLFNSEADFQQFYNNLRLGPAGAPAGSLALTVEAEKSLKQAQRVCRHYRDVAMHPCHVLVAASRLPGSVVSELLSENNISSSDIARYYVRTGQLFPVADAREAAQTLLGKLRQLLPGRGA